MKYPWPGEERDNQIETAPEPWERQPGEPLDCYRRFQLYLTLPQPRSFAAVSETLGLSPANKLVAKTARRWRWQERAAACDRRGAALLGLLNDWRSQLLNEIAYVTRFKGLRDTGRALDNAAVAKMDRAEARKRLAALDRLQRGLLNLIAPRKEIEEEEVDETKLHWPVVARSQEIGWEWEEPYMKVAERVDQRAREIGPECDEDRLLDEELENIEQYIRPHTAPDLPGEILPWEQQPKEPAKHFYACRVFLSLNLLQSTWQVAAMAGAGPETTLAKIARKWNWLERAAAFEDHLAEQPLARQELQNQLLLDQLFESQRRGLLQSTRALEKAAIDRLDPATARKRLPLLIARQRSLLQQSSHLAKASDRKSLDQRRDVRLAALVEERALEMATEAWYKSLETIKKIYGNKSMNDIEKELDIGPPPPRPQ